MAEAEYTSTIQILSEPELMRLIEKAHWQSAKTTESFAPHQYVVLGWDRDDLTTSEFWRIVRTIEAVGRLEEWTPPAEWRRRWGGRPQRNRYLYLVGPGPDDNYAYWFTHPRDSVPMLNREHVSVQEATPTRRPVHAGHRHDEEAEPLDEAAQLTLPMEKEL